MQIPMGERGGVCSERTRWMALHMSRTTTSGPSSSAVRTETREPSPPEGV